MDTRIHFQHQPRVEPALLHDSQGRLRRGIITTSENNKPLPQFRTDGPSPTHMRRQTPTENKGTPGFLRKITGNIRNIPASLARVRQRLNPKQSMRASPQLHASTETHQEPTADSLNLSKATRSSSKAARTIQDDYTLLNLIRLYLPDQERASADDFGYAVSATQAFLTGNGRRADILQARLSKLFRTPDLIRSSHR